MRLPLLFILCALLLCRASQRPSIRSRPPVACLQPLTASGKSPTPFHSAAVGDKGASRHGVKPGLAKCLRGGRPQCAGLETMISLAESPEEAAEILATCSAADMQLLCKPDAINRALSAVRLLPKDTSAELLLALLQSAREHAALWSRGSVIARTLRLLSDLRLRSAWGDCPALGILAEVVVLRALDSDVLATFSARAVLDCLVSLAGLGFKSSSADSDSGSDSLPLEATVLGALQDRALHLAITPPEAIDLMWASSALQRLPARLISHASHALRGTQADALEISHVADLLWAVAEWSWLFAPAGETSEQPPHHPGARQIPPAETEAEAEAEAGAEAIPSPRGTRHVSLLLQAGRAMALQAVRRGVGVLRSVKGPAAADAHLGCMLRSATVLLEGSVLGPLGVVQAGPERGGDWERGAGRQQVEHPWSNAFCQGLCDLLMLLCRKLAVARPAEWATAPAAAAPREGRGGGAVFPFHGDDVVVEKLRAVTQARAALQVE